MILRLEIHLKKMLQASESLLIRVLGYTIEFFDMDIDEMAKQSCSEVLTGYLFCVWQARGLKLRSVQRAW